MKKVIFTQDLGVDRAVVEKLLEKQNLNADWSMISGEKIKNSENVVCICTVSKPLLKETLQKFKNLKMVSMSFTGFDHIDKEYCLENNIPVYNVPAYSTNSVAELAIGLALSLLRQIPKGNEAVRGNEWNENLTGMELAGKKCGIIGTGTIGCRLAEILDVFGCELFGTFRTEKKEFLDLGGIYSSVEDVCKNCDIIFTTIALNEYTKDLISFKEFSLMKPTAFLVNVARGPVINRDALISAIKTNKIAGAGLDVYDYEPLRVDDEIRSLKNCVLTPHVAYKTKEVLTRKATITIENIGRGLRGGSVNRVI